MDDKKQSIDKKEAEIPTDQSNTWSLAVAILALLKQDSKKMQQHLKAISKSNRQLACSLLTTEVDGWTPAHACALRGSKKLMKAIIRTGVTVNSTMGQPEGLPSGCTLLHVAANRKDKKVVNYLLHQGANVNAVDSSQCTALDYATTLGNKEVVRLLLSWGATTTTNNSLLSSTAVPSHTRHSPSCNNSKTTISSCSQGKISRGRSPVKTSLGKFKFGSGSQTIGPSEENATQDHQVNRLQGADQQQGQLDVTTDSSPTSPTSSPEKPHSQSSSTGQCRIILEYANGASHSEQDTQNHSDPNGSHNVTHGLRPSNLYLSPRVSRRQHYEKRYAESNPTPEHERSPHPGVSSRESSMHRSKSHYQVHQTAIHHQQTKQQHQQRTGLYNNFEPCDYKNSQRQQQQSQPQPKRLAAIHLLPKRLTRLFSSTPCLLDGQPTSRKDSQPVRPRIGSRHKDDNYRLYGSRLVDFEGNFHDGNRATGSRRCSSSECILEQTPSVTATAETQRRPKHSPPKGSSTTSSVRSSDKLIPTGSIQSALSPDNVTASADDSELRKSVPVMEVALHETTI